MLAKNLRYLRKSKGYSQDYIAELLGYKSYTTIQKWEMGVSEPPFGKLTQLADLYSVDLETLSKTDLELDDTNIFTDVKKKKELTPEEEVLLEYFSLLNELGRKKAIDNLHDLTLIPIYLKEGV